MNHYLSNQIFYCFTAHFDLCFDTFVITEEFLLELLHENILCIDEFTAVNAKPSLLTANLEIVVFLLQILRANLNLIKFLDFLRGKPAYEYLVLRVCGTIRKFDDIKHFALFKPQN